MAKTRDYKRFTKICERCGAEYHPVSALQLENRKFCSRACYHDARHDYKMPEHQKVAISKAHTGREFSSQQRKNISSAAKRRIRSANPNWRGGIAKVSHLARNTEEARQWREAVFTRDRWTCQHCGKVGGDMNAHHIIPFAEAPSLRWVESNGVTLCKRCHRGVHFGGVKLAA